MATKNELLQMILKKAESLRAEQPAAIDWTQRREWWRGQVQQLLDRLSGILRPLVDAGQLQIERQDVELSEETLGTYRSESLVLTIGQRRVVIKPVASVIVGGVGRVDIQGPEGSARLILATPDQGDDSLYMSNARWHVTSPHRKLPLAELDDQSFLEIFAQLIGVRSH